MPANMPKGLMEQEEDDMDDSPVGADGAEHEASEGKSGKELDASLVYEAAMKLLSTDKARQGIVRAVQGAKDVGSVIGKLGALLVTKVSDELESRGLGVDDESAFGDTGALVRVLSAIYQTVNEEGMELPMQDSIIKAFEVGSADLEKLYSGEGQQA